MLFQLRQTPITCSTGLSARPISMVHTIIMPGVIFPSNTNKAAKPKISDCKVTRTNLVAAAIMPAFSLASACRFKNLACKPNQRLVKLGNIPIASITSALRKLLVAKLLAFTAIELASDSGFLVTFSFQIAKPMCIKVPHSAKMPRYGCIMKIMIK